MTFCSLNPLVECYVMPSQRGADPHTQPPVPITMGSALQTIAWHTMLSSFV